MKLTKLKGQSYVITGAVNIGVIVRDTECLLIDTGLDRQAGKQLLRCLKQEALTPTVIINTHSHADHYGGNAYIRGETGAQVYASSFEKAVIENPYLEPFYLFSAAPTSDLATRFLMAPACPVEGVLKPGPFTVGGFSATIIALPGHSPEQMGVVSTNGVCYCADAYFGTNIIEKYGMPYCADVSASLETLRSLAESSYSLYVPCHGEVQEKPTETITQNISVTESTLEQITSLLKEKSCTREEVLAQLMVINERKLDPVQYALNHGTISACLSHLHRSGLANYTFSEGKMLWGQD